MKGVGCPRNLLPWLPASGPLCSATTPLHPLHDPYGKRRQDNAKDFSSVAAGLQSLKLWSLVVRWLQRNPCR